MNHPIPFIMKLKNLFILFLFLIVCQVKAQVSDPAKAIDQYLTETFKVDEPGATALVIKDGKVILRKGYGFANLETKTVNTPETIFRIGSVTKQFTSTAILKLAEQGKIGLQDEITKYLPAYPTQGKKITIEHLLTHTSGIKSYTSLEEVMTLREREISVANMIDAFKDKPFDFNPGDTYQYNNSGYFLLGAIVEKVSGLSWGEYLKKNFFVPLKMTNTFYYDPKLPLQATGYQKTSATEYGLAKYVHPTVPFSAGAIFSTVDDLWKWENALFDYKVVKKENLEKAWTPLTLNSGKKESYGYGWQLARIGEDKVIGHGGGIDGFVCYELYMPSRKLFVAILLNKTPVDPQDIAFEMAYRVLGTLTTPPPATILNERSLDEFTGVYQISDKEDRVITRTGSQLFSQRSGSSKFEIVPYGKDVFYFKGSASLLKFNRNTQGKIVEAEMTSKEFVNQVAIKTDKSIPAERTVIELPALVFDQYIGEYQLAPGFIITVRREENKFMAQATGQPAFELFPESETTFFLKVVEAKIEFKKNSEGKTESLTLYQNGQAMPGKKIK